jgi:hypothetical protein
MGVYRSSKKAKRAAAMRNKTPPAEVRRFATEEEAWEWVDEASDSDSSEEEGTGDTGRSDGGARQPTGSGRGRGSHVRSTATMEGQFPFEFVHSDPSAGKGDEIFGVEINTEQQMMRELCPKGLATDQRNDLTEGWEDAMAIDGTYGTNEQGRGDEQAEDGTFSRLVDALEAIRSDRGRVGRIMRDGRWTQHNRTAVLRVTSAQDLIELNEALMSAQKVILKNRHMDFRTVLEPLQWSDEVVSSYLSGAKLPFLARETYRHYQALIQHLTGALNNGGWTQVEHDVRFFGNRLARIRRGSRTRFMFLLRTYVFLRDHADTGFQSPERTSAQARGTAERLLELEGQFLLLNTGKGTAAGTSGGTTSRNCGKCWQKFHAGKAAQCPFKNMSDGQARACGKAVKKKIAEGTEADQATREILAAPAEE